MEWAALISLIAPYIMSMFQGGNDSTGPRNPDLGMRDAMLRAMVQQNERYNRRNALDVGIVNLANSLMPQGFQSPTPIPLNSSSALGSTTQVPYWDGGPGQGGAGNPGELPPSPAGPGGGRPPHPNPNKLGPPMMGQGLDGGVQAVARALVPQGQTGFALPDYLDTLPSLKKRFGR